MRIHPRANRHHKAGLALRPKKGNEEAPARGASVEGYESRLWLLGAFLDVPQATPNGAAADTRMEEHFQKEERRVQETTLSVGQ